MKLATLLLLPLSMTLVGQTLQGQTTKQAPKTASQPAAKTLAETAELRSLRDTYGEVLDKVNASWFGSPYQQIKAVDLRGTILLVVKGSAIDNKVEQLTQGAGVVEKLGVKSGQASCRLEGTYFADGDHLYKLNGDLGSMTFQRRGEKGFLCINDSGVYTTSVDTVPPNPPLSFMGWFAEVISDIKEVYVKGTTFKVSKGKDTTVGGKVAKSIVFSAPTAAYDPKKREQAASETFSFWKKGRLEVAYEEATKQPLRMDYTNEAQGVEATMSFNYDADGRIKQVSISNRSKQWEGPGFVSATYGSNGRMSAVSGELSGPTHKVVFNLATSWNDNKDKSSLNAAPAATTKLGRDDFELRMAMLFAGNIGELQRAGFNLMAPKVSPSKPAGKPASTKR